MLCWLLGHDFERVQTSFTESASVASVVCERCGRRFDARTTEYVPRAALAKQLMPYTLNLWQRLRRRA